MLTCPQLKVLMEVHADRAWNGRQDWNTAVKVPPLGSLQDCARGGLVFQALLPNPAPPFGFETQTSTLEPHPTAQK